MLALVKYIFNYNILFSKNGMSEIWSNNWG